MTMASADFANVPDLPALLLLLSIMFWWAMMRPSMIRDFENRRLPPNPTARFIFAMLWLLAYVALVVGFNNFSEAAGKIGAGVPLANHLIENFKGQAPLLAAFTMGGLLQLSFVRDIERSTLIWLHSQRHLHGDIKQLSSHLQRSVFVSSEEEKAKNFESVRRFGVFVLDNATHSVTSPVTLASWRKVSTLLRLLHEWNVDERRVLNPDEMKILAEAETTHERKTQLALTIVRMIEQASQRGAATETLGELLGMLADTSHIDRSRVAEVEARARALIGGDASPAMDRPLRLSSDELRRHVAQIEGYFRVEYDLLVEQTSLLAAKSIILSGDKAPERFEQLKVVGFTGLGHIEPINFDRILSLFVFVAGSGFLVLFIGNIGNTGGTPPLDRLARFSLVMATAALVGAIVGSNRRYQRRRMTPWGVYFTAGLVAAAFHIGLTAVGDFARQYITGAAAPMPLVKAVPWAFVPAFMTVAICRLARVERYPIIPPLAAWSQLAERCLDGVGTSIAVLLAYYLAIAIFQMLGWELPPMIAAKMAAWHMLPIPIMLPLQVMGFLIGFFTVIDVRRAARARMLDPGGTSKVVEDAAVSTIHAIGGAPKPA